MIRRVASVVCALMAISVAGGGVAAAGTDSLDDVAERYDLVRQADLPDGYELDSVRRETGVSPTFFEVLSGCSHISTSVVFTGGDALVGRATFEETTTDGARGGQGVETVMHFDDNSDAKAYYTRFADEFDQLVRCRTMTDAIGNIGTYADLDVGRAGDQRTGLTFDPRADRYTRLGLVRDDERVVYVELYDDDATDADFTALVKQATRRSR